MPTTRDVRPIVTFKNPSVSNILLEINAILDVIIKEHKYIFGLGLKSKFDPSNIKREFRPPEFFIQIQTIYVSE